MVAYNRAISGLSGNGTVIVTKVPWGKVLPNSSPDNFNEGEVQIYGNWYGIPSPLPINMHLEF